MDVEVTGLTFAAIGHQANWQQIAALVATMRGEQPLAEDELRALFPRIPPRVVMRARFHSRTGAYADGAYVETFIDPSTLDPAHLKTNLEKVRAAIKCVAQEHIPLATLGGFTSIVAESNSLRASHSVTLTTGNTLTTYFATKGVTQAAQLLDLDLAAATLGVVGASGDIGSACVRVLGPKVREVVVSARQPQRLIELQRAAAIAGIQVRIARDNAELVRSCNVIVAAASMTEPELDLSACGPEILVCDVGYPKNVKVAGQAHVFWGGLGFVEAGWQVLSGVPKGFYEFGSPGVLHGCILEGVVLALQQWCLPYSRGRGDISGESVAAIGAAAEHHGIVLAPLMNHHGKWA